LRSSIDFAQKPFLVIWETTRSCALACRHCRAEADARRRPGELSTAQGKALINDVAAMGTPIFILSGGDPLNREDLEELVAHGAAAGLRMGTIPAATENLTKFRLERLKAAGLSQLAFSLDAPTAQAHDGFRRTVGAFERTLEGARWARELGLPLQINTCFGAWNYHLLEPMIELVRSLGVVFWEVFFLIPVGRGAELQGLTPWQFEEAFARLRRLSAEERFIVKLTEAQHFKRFLRQQPVEAGAVARPAGRCPIPASAKAVNAGNGFVFVDHLGNVCPSGFLPLPVGNVRTTPLARFYRESILFRRLRDHGLLKGKCGVCEYAAVCGGSRARAWAVTGDYLEADPSCAYVPAAMRQQRS
jgi:radical SAM protein